MSKRPKHFPGGPLNQPENYPHRPSRGGEQHFRNRPRGAQAPNKYGASVNYPPTKGPTPPPKKSRSGCFTMIALVVVVLILVAYAKSR